MLNIYEYIIKPKQKKREKKHILPPPMAQSTIGPIYRNIRTESNCLENKAFSSSRYTRRLKKKIRKEEYPFIWPNTNTKKIPRYKHLWQPQIDSSESNCSHLASVVPLASNPRLVPFLLYFLFSTILKSLSLYPIGTLSFSVKAIPTRK